MNGSKGQRTDCTFWGQKVQADGNGPVRVHIDGKSEVAGVAGQAKTTMANSGSTRSSSPGRGLSR